MAIIDFVIPAARRWARISEEAQDAVARAASHQAQLRGISDPTHEIARLLALHGLSHTPPNWQEYGGLALYLAVAYPPDLAYFVLYSARHVGPAVPRDLVPYVLKALEEMVNFRVPHVPVVLRDYPDAEVAARSPEWRAEKAAHVLAREISCVPLRYASGIWEIVNPRAKPFLRSAIEAFNPRAAAILARGSRAHFMTPAGVARGVFRLMFGKD